MKLWDEKLTILNPTTNIPYESLILTLNSTKSVKELEWVPKLSTKKSIT